MGVAPLCRFKVPSGEAKFFRIGPRYTLSILARQNRMLLANMLSTTSGPPGVLRANIQNIPDSQHHSLKYCGVVGLTWT